MAVNGIEIIVGQTWECRDGRLRTVLGNDHSKARPCSLSGGGSVAKNGRRFDESRDSYDDLVRLVSDVGETIAVASPSNPKDAIGSAKLPLHLWPAEATALGSLGMLEGECKYGRNNFIAGDGVIASIYIDAVKRHLDAWFSGEECAPDTGTPHLANALASLAIVVKARAHNRLIDDRDFAPNPGYRNLVDSITPHVGRIKELFADKSPKHYTIAESTEQSA